MGREVRRVPKDWEHPKDDNGNYIPLRDGSDYVRDVTEWEQGKAMWDRGYRQHFGTYEWIPVEAEYAWMPYDEWNGERPTPDEYMPVWPECVKTHLMMYESTSEGTPISPAFDNPEALAGWLSNNGASAFGDMTATYEQWLSTIKAGGAISAVWSPGRGLESGVAASEELDREGGA